MYIETMVYDPGRPVAPHPWFNDTIPARKWWFVAFLLSNELPRSSAQGDRPPVNGPVQKCVLVTLLAVEINAAHVAWGKAATRVNCNVPKFCPNHDSSVPAHPINEWMPVGATVPCAGRLIGCTKSVKKSCDTNWICNFNEPIFRTATRLRQTHSHSPLQYRWDCLLFVDSRDVRRSYWTEHVVRSAHLAVPNSVDRKRLHVYR